MEPSVTPKPMPASAAKLSLDHINKLFRIIYITLTGVIDTIVPAAGLWLWLGKSMSYLIKLAPILRWALPSQSATRQFPDASKLVNQENILIADPLAKTGETKYIGLKEKWYKRLSRLLKDKYNYLPAYFVPMTTPLTPQPNRPMELPIASETTSNQLFGALYITLTGMIDTMVPNSGPSSLLG
ncbi:hypothetical protein DSO57_1034930 [Entomophthora muscae]|uniref:Uncharacterized protein n=1 Tax=Entomophthora muscae TaxID=34485 RepID=A0ACC2TXJ3_9FUNG|nr:hypothetical protein DSO57_1034930 [Entomophthora muscae]